MSDINNQEEEFLITLNNLTIFKNLTYDDINTIKQQVIGAIGSVEYNSITHILTFKSINGDILEEIDLPLESVVTGGEFDSENNSLVLTFQNGDTIEIPLENLININWVEDIENSDDKTIPPTAKAVEEYINPIKTTITDINTEISNINTNITQNSNNIKAINEDIEAINNKITFEEKVGQFVIIGEDGTFTTTELTIGGSY